MPSALQKPTKFDPKQDILDRIGDVSGYQICHNEMLVAIYMRPEMTSGGIILTPTNLKEDLYQAKAHLVVKIGPGCKFPNVEVKLHDWVVIKPSDAWSLDFLGHPESMDRKSFVPCRMVYDDQIRAVIPSPSMVW